MTGLWARLLGLIVGPIVVAHSILVYARVRLFLRRTLHARPIEHDGVGGEDHGGTRSERGVADDKAGDQTRGGGAGGQKIFFKKKNI